MLLITPKRLSGTKEAKPLRCLTTPVNRNKGLSPHSILTRCQRRLQKRSCGGSWAVAPRFTLYTPQNSTGARSGLDNPTPRLIQWLEQSPASKLRFVRVTIVVRDRNGNISCGCWLPNDENAKERKMACKRQKPINPLNPLHRQTLPKNHNQTRSRYIELPSASGREVLPCR